jgi:hypothetical protein
VTRLLTFVDIDDADDKGPDARSFSLTARHDAVLADGRHVVLLDDRGWSGTVAVAWYGEPTEEERRAAESRGIWEHETAQRLEHEARMVVGPDEPFGDETAADVERGHWATLARVLQQEGIAIEGPELMALPHDVELSERVLARLGHRRADAD